MKDEAIEAVRIKNMNRLVVHRGPDGEGYYFGDNFAFGHRRLSIIDLSEKAAQPMLYGDRYVLIFNGEIYNYIEIRDLLASKGYKFHTDSDTEVILAAYDFWGVECVHQFNGMWAFAIYDKDRHEIFCSRDRFGVKPFYFTKNETNFSFGSEIKQLLEFQEKISCNKKLLIDFLVTGVLEHSDETFFNGIQKLPQGHHLIYDLSSHRYEIVPYYEIATDNKIHDLTFEESLEMYRSRLNDSIAWRLRADVKVGTCLSGGIDSSCVATLASKSYAVQSNEPFIALHAKSTEVPTDESEYAAKVADSSGMNLHIVEPQTSQFIENIEEVIRVQEEPFGGPAIFMQYFIMKMAGNIGIKVLLDGQGGDETLLGYEKYYPAFYRYVFKKSGIKAFFKAIKDSNRNNDRMNFFWTGKFFFGTMLVSLRKFIFRRRTFFMKPYLNDFPFLKEFSQAYNDITGLQKLEIRKMMIPELLRYEDKNSMYHSIETRLPFLDYQDVETALSIRPEYKIKDGWTKYISRKILDPLLPAEIVWRKNKLSYNAPVDTWMNAIDQRFLEEIAGSEIIEKITHKDKIIKNPDRINPIVRWRLFNIAVWERVYGVRILE